METKKPTEEQLAALLRWRIVHGRNWKAKLNEAWLVAGQGWHAYCPELQQLRNQFGPSWLVRVVL